MKQYGCICMEHKLCSLCEFIPKGKRWYFLILCVALRNQVESTIVWNAKVKLVWNFSGEDEEFHFFFKNKNSWNSFLCISCARKFNCISSSDLCYARLHFYSICILLWEKKFVCSKSKNSIVDAHSPFSFKQKSWN